MQPNSTPTTTQTANESVSGGPRFLIRFSVILTIIALLNVLVALAITYFAIRNAKVTTLEQASSLLPAIQFVRVSRYVAPTLAFLAAVLSFGGWRQALSALKRETENRLSGGGAIMGVPTSLLRGSQIGSGLAALMLLGSVVFAVNTHPSLFFWSVNRNCNWNQSQISCTFHITIDSKSTDTFHWEASSNPGGVIFSPSSGSIDPGQTSEEITATDTTVCPVTFIFRDASLNEEIDSYFNNACS